MVLRGKLRVYPDVSEEGNSRFKKPRSLFPGHTSVPAHVSRPPRSPPATLSERGSAAGTAGDADCPSVTLCPSVADADGRTDLLFFFRCGKMAFVSPPSATELGISKRVPAKLGAAHTCNFHRNCSEARQSPHTCYGQCESFNNALTI